MIPYLGSKSRIFKHIYPFIKQDYKRRYVELFCGSCSSLAYTYELPVKEYVDNHPDLIMMFQALQQGWLPPEYVSEELYQELKTAQPSALRGYVGFAASFAGKWFAGYARDRKGTRNIPNEVYKRIMKNKHFIRNTCFICSSYECISLDSDTVVYADPPYAGTSQYKDNFNHYDFWEWVRNSRAKIYVSEYTAPSDFIPVWSKEHKTYLHHKSIEDNKRQEQLFVHERFKGRN